MTLNQRTLETVRGGSFPEPATTLPFKCSLGPLQQCTRLSTSWPNLVKSGILQRTLGCEPKARVFSAALTLPTL